MIYTLDILLLDYKPTNSRKIKINANSTFAQLCDIIVLLYGLESEHLWEFRRDTDLFINSPDFGDSMEDLGGFDEVDFGETTWLAVNYNGSKYKLREYFEKYKEIILYYDFGDNWVFEIKLSKISEEDIKWWELIDGKWYYLLSGVGGVEWLAELMQEYKKKIVNPDLFESWEDFEDFIKPALTKFDPNNI